MSDQHICDEDCAPQPRVESLQMLDLIGLGIATVGGVFGSISSGLTAMSTEFFSAARYRREIEEGIRARAEAGFELERILGDFDG